MRGERDSQGLSDMAKFRARLALLDWFVSGLCSFVRLKRKRHFGKSCLLSHVIHIYVLPVVAFPKWRLSPTLSTSERIAAVPS